MPHTPLSHALFAILYIITLVSSVFFLPELLGAPDESIFYPMLALSTLVLSVAVMAYLFFYHPLLLVLDGEREKAARFFLHTVGIFASTMVILVLGALFVRG